MKLFAVNVPGSTHFFAKFSLFIRRNYCYRYSPHRNNSLNCRQTQSACTTPDQYHITLLQRVSFPATQHTIRSNTSSICRCGFFKGQVFSDPNALAFLYSGELCKRTIISLIAPYMIRGTKARIHASKNSLILCIVL